MCEVDKAADYIPFALTKRRCVENMLVCEYRFPRKYKPPKERLLSRHIACLYLNDHDGTDEVFKRYGVLPEDLEMFAREKSYTAVMNLTLALLFPFRRHVLTDVWTGYRILGTVLEPGSPVNWTFQLFAEDPRGTDVVHTSLG